MQYPSLLITDFRLIKYSFPCEIMLVIYFINFLYQSILIFVIFGWCLLTNICLNSFHNGNSHRLSVFNGWSRYNKKVWIKGATTIEVWAGAPYKCKFLSTILHILHANHFGNGQCRRARCCSSSFILNCIVCFVDRGETTLSSNRCYVLKIASIYSSGAISDYAWSLATTLVHVVQYVTVQYDITLIFTGFSSSAWCDSLFMKFDQQPNILVEFRNDQTLSTETKAEPVRKARCLRAPWINNVYLQGAVSCRCWQACDPGTLAPGQHRYRCCAPVGTKRRCSSRESPRK